MQYQWLIVQACEFQADGDAVHRFHAPSHALSELPGVCVIDVCLNHRRLPELMQQADVLILAGFDADLVPFVEQRRSQGKITMFEANDYYYDIQSWNPLATRWYDRALQAACRQGLELCDAVQTSMPELARQWRLRTTRPVVAFLNQLGEVPPLEPRPNRPLTIGWGGSPGHFADWFHLAPKLQRWLEKNPQVHLAVMNSEFARSFIQLSPERYHYTPFGSLADYLAFLKRLDIGLAPLLPSDYNRCRSDVKFLEYASRGVVGIYAELEPYRDSVVHGETGLVYRTDEELFSHLDCLVSDAALRNRLRQQAHAYVVGNRQLRQNIQTRWDFYRSLLPAEPRGGEVSAGVLALAERNGRYLQLRAQEPEQTLTKIQKTPTSAESLNSLRNLVEQHPDYLPALQTLGYQWNDQRQPQALNCLERARNLYPQSARTLAEIARCHFRNGRAQDGLEMLKRTVEMNPHSLTAWQYLLKLLQAAKATDGAAWAAKSREFHPENYGLALLGARLYPLGEAIPLLQNLVETHAPTLAPEELATASAAFSEAIREIVSPHLATPVALSLLTVASRAFPHSALLSNLHSFALRAAGRLEDGYREAVRALELRRAAQTFRLEFPRDDGIFFYGQFSEQILGHTSHETN